MFHCLVELYGFPSETAPERKITVELREGAGMGEVIAELKRKVPGLEGRAFRPGENRLADLYKFNLNGVLYYDGMDFRVGPGDRLALLTLVTGG